MKNQSSWYQMMVLPSWPIGILEYWKDWRKLMDETDKDGSNGAMISLKVHEE